VRVNLASAVITLASNSSPVQAATGQLSNGASASIGSLQAGVPKTINLNGASSTSVRLTINTAAQMASVSIASIELYLA
jgi:hypothetical protein